MFDGQLSADIDVFLGFLHLTMLRDILLALFLGLMVGYERYYRGRAAGMRTYGFVCMASCALAAIGVHSSEVFLGLYGGHAFDPGHILQGIIAGIGFLGAGVIMRDGMSISGLTTAASIWSLATVGVLVGVGFYVPAIFMATLLMTFMMWRSKIEFMLPARHALSVVLNFSNNHSPDEGDVRALFSTQGYRIAAGSFAITVHKNSHEWRFVAISDGKGKSASLTSLSHALSSAPGIESSHFTHARN